MCGENPKSKRGCDEALVEILGNLRDSGWVWIPGVSDEHGFRDDLSVVFVVLIVEMFVTWCDEIYMLQFDLIIVDYVVFSPRRFPQTLKLISH